MTLPLLATVDQREIARLAQQLPQATLLIAEQGIDGPSVACHLAEQQPSDIRQLDLSPSATNLPVESIRQLTHQLRTHSNQRRVVLIPQAAALSEAAQNALLKTLEEPGDRTHFILVAQQPSQLLATVRSRCQIVILHRTSPAQDQQLLEQLAPQLPAQQQQQIRFLAAGRPLLIEQLATDKDLLSQYQTIASDAKQLLLGPNTYQSLVCLQPYIKDRAKARQLLDILLTMLRHQAYRSGLDQSGQHRLELISSLQNQLEHNGQLRLILLQLVV